MNNFIDFKLDEVQADPAVQSLVDVVGERIGDKRLSAKERKKKAKEREKAVNRARRGIVRWSVEVEPSVKELVVRMAEELDVPVSQVINELLVQKLEQDGLGEVLEGLRILGKNGSRRFDYFIPYRGVPMISKGRPLKNEGASLEKSKGRP